LEVTIQLDSIKNHTGLFGPADSHLKMLRRALDVQFTARQENLIISGRERCVKEAMEIIDRMQKLLITKGFLSDSDVRKLLTENGKVFSGQTSEPLAVYSHKKVIEPLTKGQLKYVEMMLANDLTFCIGPAGTGKTYLAVAVAVSMLKKKQIRKMILTRPAVEAGEKLGFLPGDMQAKVNPYLRPLFDALGDMMDYVQMKNFMEMDVIEIIPLAFMRGRTLNEAVIICDEAQNTLPMQMLMVLTRLGRGSKMIVTGDITQIDLDRNQKSGMVDAIEKLRGIKGIGYIELNRLDIVRHRLVQRIVQAYAKDRKRKIPLM